jgi:hypothetical protein
VGLERVEPFGPDAWKEAIVAGYDPEEDRQFGRRPQNELLPDEDVEWLASAHSQTTDAIAAKRLRDAAPAQCGSMSWCGAVDRYPDTRDMGYPFCRSFGDGADAIRDTFVELSNAAARTVTIKHV